MLISAESRDLDPRIPSLPDANETLNEYVSLLYEFMSHMDGQICLLLSPFGRTYRVSAK